jgi:hypothetical protein
MGRVNKQTSGVFVNIAANEFKTAQYDNFINKGPESPSSALKKYTKMYKDYVDKERINIDRLALIEELIMQHRTKEAMEKNEPTEIKLSIVKNYIYARCPFFRRDKTAKDVRIIVDNLEFWTNNIKSKKNESIVKALLSNEEFMNKAKLKLLNQMTYLINENIQLLDKLNETTKKQKTEEKVVA